MTAGALATRRLVKTGLAGLARWTGAGGVLGGILGARPGPLVLAYHRVVGDYSALASGTIPAMLVSCAMLERHLDWIGRRYRFVTLDELGGRLESGAPAARLAAVTFDDGYADAYEHAFPLVRRKGIPAAVFVVTDLLGSSRPYLHDRLFALLRRVAGPGQPSRLLSAAIRACGHEAGAFERLGGDPQAATTLVLRRLPREDADRVADAIEAEIGPCTEEDATMRALTWDMLDAMAQGGMTVGSHTRTHALLTQEDDARRADELQRSRALLELRLGRAVRHLAYPDGRWNASVAWAAERAGYRFAYTTCGHRNPHRPLLTIPRVPLWEASCLGPFGGFSPSVMSAHATGLLGRLGRCDGGH